MRRVTLILLTLMLSSSCGDLFESGSGTEIMSGSNIHVNQIDAMDETKLINLIEKRAGNVLFINVWATWCVPCREEFPDLVRLADYYDGKNVDIIGLNIEYPDELESKVKPFLMKMNVNFKNYIHSFETQENLINLFNEGWNGALPATFIYDKNGKQHYFRIGKHSFDEFKSLIDSVNTAIGS